MRRRTGWTGAAALAVGLFACAPVDAQVAIGGHFLATVAADDLQVRVDDVRVLWLIPTTGSPHLIFGSDGNDVTADRVGGTVGGGGGATADGNRVGGDYATVGGGRGNVAGGELSVDDFPDATVRGGELNGALQAGATVGGGSSNLSSGPSATVAGGATNQALALGSTVGGGSQNTASASYATVPGGEDAVASLWGQMAFSSGGFAPQAGDAQASLYVVRRLTLNNTPLELRLDGDLAALTVAPGRALAFRALIAARSDTGDSAGYLATGTIANVGGTTSFVGTPTVTALGEDDSAWNLFLLADDIDDVLSIRGLGRPATTVRWVGTVETVEVDL